MSRPSSKSPDGTATPATARTVGKMSMVETSVSVTTPLGVTPGHNARAG
eukprot:CAMPEP_0206320988 /NCGR_PEP_ID=MMETSP0106_2-20121207/18632_1 /ASSEMBLY_ACC=CAM_ASM_000206 /TAXON_ID=81532 /ORGANISM="Acanthoeca-like sp., Strain 10tr" /LENGTH=48 /DNA_ID= /DNA_START= /DNA_END= /DNA_ORIENTATION=